MKEMSEIILAEVRDRLNSLNKNQVASHNLNWTEEINAIV